MEDSPLTKVSVSKKQERAHYVNNKDFVNAVVDYVKLAKIARNVGTEVPRIPEYIGQCFIAIAERSSRRSNFISYPYREEMVTDGILDCVKAVLNYNIDAPTRKGLPNAFGYFTQIVFWAFLRRIAKEKKQDQIKNKYRDNAGIDAFADFSDDDHHGEGMIERVRHRNDMFNGGSQYDEPPEEVCEALKKKRSFPPRKTKEDDDSLPVPTTKKASSKKKKVTLDQFLS